MYMLVSLSYFKKNKTIINKVLILNYKYVKTLNYQTNKK